MAMGRVRGPQSSQVQTTVPRVALTAIFAVCVFSVLVSLRSSTVFVVGLRFQACTRPSVPIALSRSRMARNFFGDQGKLKKGPPPPPAARQIPVEMELESSVGSVTQYPRDEQGFRGLLDIVTYPHPSLRRPNLEVTLFDENLKDFVKSLVRRMKQGGVALAAPQVGVNLRIFVMNVDEFQVIMDPFNPDKKNGNMVFINPQIVAHSDSFEDDLENSFSTTSVQGEVARSKTVLVNAVDMSGNPFKLKMDKPFMARVFQNCYDHLDGILMIDRFKSEELEKWLPSMVERTQTYLQQTAVLYETMGLTPDTPADEVKRTYKKMMLQYHPDRSPSEEDLEKFKEIKIAYKVLQQKLGV